MFLGLHAVYLFNDRVHGPSIAIKSLQFVDQQGDEHPHDLFVPNHKIHVRMRIELKRDALPRIEWNLVLLKLLRLVQHELFSHHPEARGDRTKYEALQVIKVERGRRLLNRVFLAMRGIVV